jgi:microcystin-dependent protein
MGEIRMFGGNFAPNGWMFCDGSALPISGNEALYTLIGTTYGGDGQTTFRLPNLCGRVPIHQGTNPAPARTFVPGQAGGAESVSLKSNEMPNHSHALNAAVVSGDATTPANNLPANSASNVKPYINEGPDGSMKGDAIMPVGGSQPHDNRQPFLGISFIIATSGVFPAQ